MMFGGDLGEAGEDLGEGKDPSFKRVLPLPKPHPIPENSPQSGFILTAHFGLLCGTPQSTGNVQRYEARLREVFYGLVGW